MMEQAPSHIMFARSVDAAPRWSTPLIVGDDTLTRVANVAVDPASGAV